MTKSYQRNYNPYAYYEYTSIDLQNRKTRTAFQIINKNKINNVQR